WTRDELAGALAFDHGYTPESPVAQRVLDVLSELDAEQRRAFLQFVTGSPRAPAGGVGALAPRLTVVRKMTQGDADAELPSAMTCANYIKMPPYSSADVLRRKLLYVIREGQQSFDLS
ncbi:HECT ubiquitin-transferase, partial [Helicosporidium sp. ATCC 50920]